MNKRIYEIKVRLAADEMAYLNQLVAGSWIVQRNLFADGDFGSCPKGGTAS